MRQWLFRRFGAAVTVIEAATPLANDDPECAAILLDQLKREGVAIRAGTNVLRVEPGARPRVCQERKALVPPVLRIEAILRTNALQWR